MSSKFTSKHRTQAQAAKPEKPAKQGTHPSKPSKATTSSVTPTGLRRSLPPYRQVEEAVAKWVQEAGVDLRAMREWVAKMNLVAAERELNTVIAELGSLGGEVPLELPERPELWSWRHWLTARISALRARIGQ